MFFNFHKKKAENLSTTQLHLVWLRKLRPFFKFNYLAKNTPPLKHRKVRKSSVLAVGFIGKMLALFEDFTGVLLESFMGDTLGLLGREPCANFL